MWRCCMGGEYHRITTGTTRVVSNVSCRISPVRILTWPRRFQRPACKHFRLMSYLLWKYLIFWLNPLQHIWSLQLYWMPSGSWKWMPLEKYCFLSKFAFATSRSFQNVLTFFSTLNFNIVSKLSKGTDCAGCPVGHGWLAKVPRSSNGLPWSCDVMCCMLRWSLGRLGLKMSRKSLDCAIRTCLPQFRRQVSGTHGTGLGDHFKELNQGWQTSSSLHEMTEITEMMWADACSWIHLRNRR